MIYLVGNSYEKKSLTKLWTEMAPFCEMKLTGMLIHHKVKHSNKWTMGSLNDKTPMTWWHFSCHFHHWNFRSIKRQLSYVNCIFEIWHVCADYRYSNLYIYDRLNNNIMVQMCFWGKKKFCLLLRIYGKLMNENVFLRLKK